MPPQGLLPATERMLLRRVAAEQASGRAPSLVAAVVRDGATVWFGSRGYVGEARPGADTQYRIGSITKTFTAVLVMRLRDEGRLRLGDCVDAHVPGTAVGDRTVAQLLAHLGGVAAETPDPWWERTPGKQHPDIADALGPDPAKHRPGRRFHYSNVAYALLGELVARLRGTSWAEALATEILLPLEMSRTTLLPAPPHATGWAVHPWADVLLPEPAHDAGVMAPAGQLWSTAADLARWLAFLGGDTGPVLPADTLAEMREPAAVDDDADGGAWRSGCGLGLQLSRDGDRCRAGHLGSMPGFLAAVWVDPAEGTGALALANATAGPAVGDLAVDLLDTVANQEPRLPAEWAPAAGHAPHLLELTGAWYWGPAPFAMTLLPGGELQLSPLRRSPRESRFRPEADGTWTGLDGYFAGETLSAHRRPDGTVGHLNIASFVFTRTPYDPAAPIPGGVDPAGWQPAATGPPVSR